MEEASGEETTVTANTRTEGRRAAVLGCRDDGGPRAVDCEVVCLKIGVLLSTREHACGFSTQEAEQEPWASLCCTKTQAKTGVK